MNIWNTYSRANSYIGGAEKNIYNRWKNRAPGDSASNIWGGIKHALKPDSLRIARAQASGGTQPQQTAPQYSTSADAPPGSGMYANTHGNIHTPNVDELTNLYGGNSGGGGGYAAGANRLSQAEMAISNARNKYNERFDAAKNLSNEYKNYAEQQFQTAKTRAGEKKGELGQQYKQQLEKMQSALGSAQQGITGAYGARGLGDSSFALKAQAEADKQFNDNLSYLHEQEASQYKEIDNYLTDLERQREMQRKEADYKDYSSEQDYIDATAKLDSELNDIKAQKEQLRTEVSKATAGIGGMSQIDATMQFYNNLDGILKTAMSSTKKKQILSGLFTKMGYKNPDRQADYYEKWAKRSEEIAQGMNTPENANNEFLTDFGIEPF